MRRRRLRGFELTDLGSAVRSMGWFRVDGSVYEGVSLSRSRIGFEERRGIDGGREEGPRSGSSTLCRKEGRVRDPGVGQKRWVGQGGFGGGGGASGIERTHWVIRCGSRRMDRSGVRSGTAADAEWGCDE